MITFRKPSQGKWCNLFWQLVIYRNINFQAQMTAPKLCFIWSMCSLGRKSQRQKKSSTLSKITSAFWKEALMKYCSYTSLDSKQKKQVSHSRHLQIFFLCCHGKLLWDWQFKRSCVKKWKKLWQLTVKNSLQNRSCLFWNCVCYARDLQQSGKS